MERTAAEFGAANALSLGPVFTLDGALMEDLKPQMSRKGACQEMNELTGGILGYMVFSGDLVHALCPTYVCDKPPMHSSV